MTNAVYLTARQFTCLGCKQHAHQVIKVVVGSEDDKQSLAVTVSVTARTGNLIFALDYFTHGTRSNGIYQTPALDFLPTSITGQESNTGEFH